MFVRGYSDELQEKQISEKHNTTRMKLGLGYDDS